MAISNLLIDCQVLQTNAWTRGMGRYLASLIMGIYQNQNPPKVYLIFNKNLQTNPSCFEVIEKVAPAAEVAELDFYEGLSELAERSNVVTLDKWVETKGLKGSLFLSGSLFSFDYQPALPSYTINACIFYDMIPLKHWQSFYQYFPEHEYFKRFKFLYLCDFVYAISEAARQDLLKYLSLDSQKVINIGGAEIPHFMGKQQAMPSDKPIRPYRYILLPGGNSPHKNMLRAIRGFDEFNAEFGDSFRLVITSFYSAEDIARMQALSPNIELTGEISDAELHSLYEQAEMVLFPSLDEGLGLPILEAVGYDRPVACSDIGVFKEISKDGFYFFDPYNTASIAEALIRGIIGTDRQTKRRSYAAIKSNFTWEKVAKRVIETTASDLFRPTLNSQPLAILVEQAGDLKTLEIVSQCLATARSIEDVHLYIDELFERQRKLTSVPLLFTAFLHHRDIADAPTKVKKGRSYVCLTDRTELTIPIGLSLGSKFIGTEAQLKQSGKRLSKSLSQNQNNELTHGLTKRAAKQLVSEKLNGQ